MADSYHSGSGAEVDKKKAKHYYELAAINGDIYARYNIGVIEGHAGNHQQAYKHLTIAARVGCTKSLDLVKGEYMNGFVTKEEYANTLRAYQTSQDEMKSDSRDKARALYELHG